MKIKNQLNDEKEGIPLITMGYPQYLLTWAYSSRVIPV
ncbi:hypothetical protein J2Z26_001906 [Bacillus luteolus]|nr:hypothetical protein [Cytobacillus luteolus]